MRGSDGSFIAPDGTQVADHTWPDGSSTSVRKDWIGEEWRLGRRTLIITHTNPDGSLRRRIVWRVGVCTLELLGTECGPATFRETAAYVLWYRCPEFPWYPSG